VVGIIWLAILGSAIWVGFDAHTLGVKRGRLGGGTLDMGVASWVVCCLFIWVIAFPCYIVARGRYQSMAAAGTYGAFPTTVAPVPAHQYGQFPGAQQPAVYAAPPQFSPDGQWWWNGVQWVPAAPTTQQVVQPN
jgi:hypothetical protein